MTLSLSHCPGLKVARGVMITDSRVERKRGGEKRFKVQGSRFEVGNGRYGKYGSYEEPPIDLPNFEL
jgi:hypothetical protein